MIGTLPVIEPKSPKIRSLPSPVVIVSPPVPPMTQSCPVPVIVIVSAAPSFGLIALIPVKPPWAAVQPMVPLSPRTMLSRRRGDRVVAGAADDDVVAAAGR